jgi:hypothetical protein
MSSQKIFAAFDNGVSATIGAVSEDGEWTMFRKVPTYREQEYMKTKVRFMTHIDQDAVAEVLAELARKGELVLVTERPFVNPRMFKATMSGVRAHEILLAALRTAGVVLHDTWDSKHWQKPVLGDCETGETKPRSLEVGCELYPQHAEAIKKHGDADGLLMAHWLRECCLGEKKKKRAKKKDLEP